MHKDSPCSTELMEQAWMAANDQRRAKKQIKSQNKKSAK